MIYISGQITGLELKEAQANFEAAEQHLSEHGHTEIVNPMKLVPYHPDLTWKDYMIEDIKAIFDCKGMYMLSNWKESKGAKIEHAIAEHLGLSILYQH